MSPITYARNLEVRRSSTYIYYGSLKKGVWLYNGNLFNEAEFNLLFPIDKVKIRVEDKQNPKGKNPDSRRNFLYQ
jgi:hypothetical protein